MRIGNLFHSKQAEAAITDVVRANAQDTLTKTRDVMERRFAHLEALLKDTLVELRDRSKSVQPITEQKLKDG